MDIEKSRLYVTTEKTYASGNLFGHWMELSAYPSKSRFLMAYREMYKGEADPELKILDWQDVPACLVAGNDISGKIFRFIRMIYSFDNHQKQAFNCWLELRSCEICHYMTDEFFHLFKNSYRGYFPAKEDFGKYYAQEYLAIENPDFNYRQFTKQLFDTHFIEFRGYVFEN